jgi:hypothetical protein
MQPSIYLEFEAWIPRRGGVLVALGIWVAGFVMAAGIAVRMHHESVRTRAPTTSSLVAAPIGAPDATTGSQDTVFMPDDVVVGRRSPLPDAPTLPRGARGAWRTR